MFIMFMCKIFTELINTLNLVHIWIRSFKAMKTLLVNQRI